MAKQTEAGATEYLTITGSRARLVFPSFAEYLDWNERNDYRGAASPTVRFNGCTSTGEAVAIGRAGLAELGQKSLKLSEEALRLVDAQLIDTRFTTFNSVEGAYVDLDAYLLGEPECMMQFAATPTEMTEPIVTIVIATGILGDVNGDEIEERGARVMALLDAIERTGTQAEIWSDATTLPRTGSKLGRVSVKLKEAGEPFDASLLMFAMTSKAMHRGLGFNAKHGFPAAWRTAFNVEARYGGYGRTAHGDLRNPEDYPEGHLYIPALEYGAAEFSVEDALRKLGLIAS